jgi:alginate O-acetyltransferase complex protein AlgI
VLFNSLNFALFFPVVFATYWILPHRWQNRMLLVASYVFYGSWDWRFLFLIFLSTGVDYACGLRMHVTPTERGRRALLLASLVTNLGLLGVFKYFDFFATSFASLAAAFGVRVDVVLLDLILPVGISFYTFQTLSYTIDVYHRRIEPERDLTNFALYVAFFPQLVAGPIERAERLLVQLRRPRRMTAESWNDGLWLVLWGYFLKVFMADNLAPIADEVFGANGQGDAMTVAVGIYAFAWQIFGDFAGYSFIATGIARLLGVELSINFLFPYFVTNPRDFWRNWHISLSTWLRDYLYVPLGGNRGSEARRSRNLLLTMLLGGLWHGASWIFVIWGGYQGLLLVAHRALCLPREGLGARVVRAFAWPFALRVLVMFHLTCLGLVIFRSTSVDHMSTMLATLVTQVHAPTESVVMMALRLVTYAAPGVLVLALQRRSGDVMSLGGIPAPLRLGVVVAMLYALLVWGNYGGGEFIYFRF